jgi:hypothetical protein
MNSSVWAFWAAQGRKEENQFEFFLSTFSTFHGHFLEEKRLCLHQSNDVSNFYETELGFRLVLDQLATQKINLS